jgi:glycosyltransferase involved in cell wall biosynthesis
MSSADLSPADSPIKREVDESDRPALPATQRFSVVCVSAQEWDSDLPTNRQQIMRRLAARGHEVLFVESGSFVLRRPRALARQPLKALRRLLATDLGAPGIRVCNGPNVIPWGKKYRLASRVNFWLTAQRLRRLTRRLARPLVLWIYDPCAEALIGACGEQLAVYDCVDDYGEQYARDRRRRELVSAADIAAARRSAIVFATTTTLFERHRRNNTRTHLVPNVGDYDHFSPAADRSLAPAEISRLPRPVLGFGGNLQRSKVDFEVLHRLASRRSDWTLVLIGPVRADAVEHVNRLKQLPNVHWLGRKEYADLPRYYAAFDVGLCPYVWSKQTRSIFPLKLYEYLAVGIPVVASGTPDVAGLEPDVVLASGSEEFVAAVEAALLSNTPDDRARRQAIAARNTWESRTTRLLALITDGLEERA